jgi:hypothetical protein
MRKFALGYQQDAEDYGYPSHRNIMALAPSLPKADHLPFRKGLIWQDGAGMCVGTATKRCVQLWQNLNGFASEFMMSGQFAYDVGRAQAFAGLDPDNAPALVDRGSQPGLVLRAAREVGIVLDADYPDPTAPAWNSANVNRGPSPHDLVKAYDARHLEFYQVMHGAWGFKESIRACMVRRHPVMLSMFVDTGVMANTGAIVTAIFTGDPAGGGHMLTVLDASRDDFAVLDNWWDNVEQGIEWGMPAGNILGLPRGTWRISWALLERALIQCFAVAGVPFVRRPQNVTPIQ